MNFFGSGNQNPQDPNKSYYIPALIPVPNIYNVNGQQLNGQNFDDSDTVEPNYKEEEYNQHGDLCLRILMVSHHFNQYDDSIPIGGVQRHIEKITKELRDLKHEVIWAYPAETNKWQPEEFLNYDAVFCHDFSSFCNNCPENVPMITIFHGYEGVYPVESGTKKLRAKVAEESDYTINIGNFIEKIYEIPADEVWQGGTSYTSKNNIEKCELDAVFIGHLELYNHPEEALKFAKEKGWQKVLIIGKGKMLESLSKQYPDYMFIGEVSEEESIKKALNNSKNLLIGGYLSMLDGMIRGIPVYGFTGQKEGKLDLGRKVYLQYIDENLHLNTDDPEKLEANREYILQNLTWDIIAESYEAIAYSLKTLKLHVDQEFIEKIIESRPEIFEYAVECFRSGRWHEYSQKINQIYVQLKRSDETMQKIDKTIEEADEIIKLLNENKAKKEEYDKMSLKEKLKFKWKEVWEHFNKKEKGSE